MKFAKILTVAVLLGTWASGAQAVDVPGLYTAEVPYNKDAKNPRDKAYRAALIEVLTRVSGNAVKDDLGLIDALFPAPDTYVTQFRPTEDKTMWVSFDGDAIERVLRKSGVTVWGGERPLTLVWLAVDWGQGAREIVAAGDPDKDKMQSRSIDRNRLLRERLLEIAHKRGLPIAFPLLDTTDLQLVSFSDVWGGFDERVKQASERYDVSSVLIGRVRPSSSQNNRWTYYFGDEERSYTGAPENVVGQIAGLLAAEFAVGGSSPIRRLVLNVSGVESVDAYGAVQRLLADTAMIESYRISLVTGDTVSYEVQIRGGIDRLRRALRFGGLLEQESAGGLPDFGGSAETGTSLDFFFTP